MNAQFNRLGLFQIYACVSQMTVFQSSGQIYYALTFLELFQDYICPSYKPDCDHTDRCNDPTNVLINWDSERSLDNWVERLNLACMLLYLTLQVLIR